ncbi:hypothetical protein O0L34_g2733 [Tuta absoluta]|nr:hypothetical protein O0L34_g2733 [Tuta absoluta]
MFDRLRLAARHERLARVYHAYDAVHWCVHEPFSLSQPDPDALFNAARYLLALLDDGAAEPPPGISMFVLYLCLAKQAKALNANFLARQMLDKLLGFQIPQKFQESVELLMVKTRGGATSAAGAGGGDEARDDDAAVLCWRCRRHAPPLCALRCPHCQHAPAHALLTHEVLPLVEFVPEEGISTEEALDLIELTPIPESQGSAYDEAAGAEVLRIDHDLDSADPFLDRVDEEEDSGVVVCSRAALLALSPACVVIARRNPPRFYRNMLPELPVTACPSCHHLLYADDYEIQRVTKGHCPFCRHPSDESEVPHSPPPDSSPPLSPPNDSI